jgi:hypothetical protein
MTAGQTKVLRDALATQQKQTLQREIAMEGARSILVSKGALKKLLRDELLLQQKSKATLRK